MIDPIYGRIRSQYSLAEQDEHQRLLAQIRKPDDAILMAQPCSEGAWQVTTVTRDRMSILSLIAGLMTAHRIRFIRGNVFTVPPSADGDVPAKALNIFEVVSDEIHDINDWDEIRRQLEGLVRMVVKGQVSEAQQQVIDQVSAVIGQVRDQYEPLMPVEVSFDNETDPDLTGLHVHSVETPGFLFTFTNALSMLETDIQRATIETQKKGVVHDTFWIRDTYGQKITSAAKLQQIRTASVLIKQFAYLLPFSANPLQALRQFRELVKRLLRDPDTQPQIDQLRSSETMHILAQFMGVSRHLWEDFLRMQHANLFPMVSDTGMLDKEVSRQELETMLQTELAQAADEDEQVDRLNGFKDREIFRADLRHITRRVDVTRFTREITNVAQVSVSQAMRLCYERTAKRFGPPWLENDSPCRWSVLALGKCGGGEMGFASDIELMVVYEGGGQTQGQSPVGNQKFFLEVVYLFLKIFKAQKDGIFEVDLRLRPFGKDGLLASSLEALKTYYSPQGKARQFERMALVRMQPIGGDEALGVQVMEIRDAFVYSQDPLDLEEIRRLRQRQADELVTPGHCNAKYSPGGLVDIEYFIQALQIAGGQEDQGLRVTNTLEALNRLESTGVLSSDLTIRLRKGYLLLRRLIDALRVVRGHAKDLTLPASYTKDYLYLARRLEYTTGKALQEALTGVMDFCAGLWQNQNHFLAFTHRCPMEAYCLLVCTDTHTRMKLPAFDFPPALAWLHGGDFYMQRDDNRPLGSESLKAITTQKQAMEDWLARCPLPVYTVRGNHDIADPWNFFSRTSDITGYLVKLTSDLWLAGMGWNGKEFYNLPANDDLLPVCETLKAQLRQYCRPDHRLIVLSHYPANTDLSEGYACIDELLAEFHPRVLIQGHIHETFGKQTTLSWPDEKQTLVVNPGATGGVLSLSTTSQAVTFTPA